MRQVSQLGLILFLTVVLAIAPEAVFAKGTKNKKTVIKQNVVTKSQAKTKAPMTSKNKPIAKVTADKKVKLDRGKVLKDSIKSAASRASKEQERIRVKMDFEADERVKSWADLPEDPNWSNSSDSKLKKPLKKSSIPRLKLAKPDYTVDDYANETQDHSGLNEWQSHTDTEKIDIDFDKELREVSSLEP